MNKLKEIKFYDFIKTAYMDGGKTLFVIKASPHHRNKMNKKKIREAFLSIHVFLKVNGKPTKDLKNIKKFYASTTEKIKVHRFDRGIIMPGADVSSEVIETALKSCNGNLFQVTGMPIDFIY